MSERSTIEIIGSSRKYINQYEISTNFNLPNSSSKKQCVIPIVGKYNGYTIETDVINGKMNGKTIVRNEDGVIMEELYLVNDSREGECFTWGSDKTLVFRGMYEDDKRNGIGYSYTDGEEDRIIRYEMDVAKIEYKKRSDMDGYWEERDVSTNKIIAITQLNNEYEREGHCYVFNNSGSIVSANIYSKGDCHMYKSFENDTMTIYDKNSYRVYIGGYRNDMKEDYPCNGKGKCYNVNNGKVKVVYEGDFVNNTWEGEGKYYIKGKLRYEGRMKNGYACGEGKYYDEDGVVEASGEWEYGYLNVGGNKWLNFESGKYEKGKELCGLKDMKKRGGEYKSGMDVCWEGTGNCFLCVVYGIGYCCISCWEEICK